MESPRVEAAYYGYVLLIGSLALYALLKVLGIPLLG